MDDLLQEFLAETREMLAAISGEIIAWEADPGDRPRLDSIFRFVHTVKGSCGFLNLPRLERLSHAAEGALAAVRDGERQPDVQLVNAVLAVIDRIGELTEAIENGEGLSDSDDQRLIAALEAGVAAPVASSAPAPQAAAGVPARAASRSIRLPIDLLDRMMGGVSDMVLARNELSRKLRDGMVDGAIEAAFERLSLCVAEMRDAITRTRMQRIDHIFSALPRMVRDLSAELGKVVALEVEGGDVELDREMIEMIRDPLTHIIRNAIDHGIEPAEDRRAAGKSAAGRLAVSARQAGNQILIEVVDDGRGIDGDRLAVKAVAAGVLTREHVEALTWAQKLALVFEPGLSTADAISAISGRGVGMDVVRSNIERIGGLVDIDSRPGQGVRLALRVPLTLTIIPALTVSAGGQTFAIPRAAIEEIVRATGDGVRLESIGGARVAAIRGRRMPIVSLGRLTRLADRDAGSPTLVVLRPAGGAYFALSVDAVHDHEELVVKPAAPAVMATGIYAGTTLPDNGRPMLLLDPAGIAAASGVAAAGSFAGRFASDLMERLLRIGHARPEMEAVAPPVVEAQPSIALGAAPVSCLAIGASTGGLHALSDFFGELPADFAAPILVTQHLPAAFMPYFASQLAEIAGRRTRVAEDGMRLLPGELLIAPGEGHLGLVAARGAVRVLIDRTPAPSGCLPSVDPMFEAVAAVFGAGAAGVVLSGMGRDGLIGARAIAAAGGEILAQDSRTSVVWGMPGAVANAGLASAVLPPARLAQRIALRNGVPLWN